MLRVTASLLVALVAASPTPAPSPASIDPALNAAYATLQAGLLHNDAAALSPLLEPSFHSREIDGTVNDRAAYLKNAAENDPGVTISQLTIAVTKFSRTAAGGRADATYTFTGTYTINGITKPLQAITQATDEWSLTSGAWKMRSSTVHDEASYVGGVLVQHQHETATGSPIVARMPTPAQLAALKARAVVIPTLDLNADPAQFRRIGSAIGNARIVGMGEGTHGTAEFFAFKDRLYRYLVEKKGFTVFAIEAAWGSGLSVDRYIKTGRGSAQRVVAGLGFLTADNQETVDLVQWMRRYNAAPGAHPILSFAGIDMQNPSGAINYLAAYVRDHDPSAQADARSALACVVDTAASYPPSKPAVGCAQRVTAFGATLTANAPPHDVTLAHEAVANVLQYLAFANEPALTAAAPLRDRDMADNVSWLATQAYPHAKIALWAHNGHIGASSFAGYKTMGVYLRERYGSGYYAIAQTFGRGTVRVGVVGSGLEAVTIPPNPDDTVAALFAPLRATAFVDLRGAHVPNALAVFFSSPRGLQEIGGQIDPRAVANTLMPTIVPTSFDGLVYVPIGSAATYGVPNAPQHREFQQGGVVWRVWGLGFDDVAVATTATSASLSNDDGLNATPQTLARRFDAAPFLGETVRFTGELRRDALAGYVAPIASASDQNSFSVATTRGDPIVAADGVWTPFALTLQVPKDAVFIFAGLQAQGLGSAEVRDVNVAPDRPDERASPP